YTTRFDLGIYNSKNKIRQNLKIIRRLHNFYINYLKFSAAHGDKLQILSISVDKDKIDWQNAIEKLNLTDWPQLIENYNVDREKYYFAEQADMSLAYRVEQIPCFILIDKNGTITGRWPHLTPDAIKEIKQRVLE
ncbi:MAG: thioredoxin family protein, partial [Alistipes sp.]|nr:thioredoxin family protein [Alistipes sp.]